MVHYYYPSSGQALCHSFVKGSHLLPSQLPGEHTGHEAASRCSEPIWNAHYSSTHHYCLVPILHLGEVRHTWSSHLAQGCYIAANWQHWALNLQCVDSESHMLSTWPSHLYKSDLIRYYIMPAGILLQQSVHMCTFISSCYSLFMSVSYHEPSSEWPNFHYSHMPYGTKHTHSCDPQVSTAEQPFKLSTFPNILKGFSHHQS